MWGEGRIIFRRHAVVRMIERGISEVQIREVLERGAVIEERPDDQPYPSRLMFAVIDGIPLHVAMSFDAATETTFVVTVYEPDPGRWDITYRFRKP